MVLFLLEAGPKLPRGSVIILDNARIHHSEKLQSVWAMLKATFGVDHAFLPPYSPFLNAAEYFFCKVKGIVKRERWADIDQLEQKIRGAINSVTTMDTNNFYQKVRQHLQHAAKSGFFTGTPLYPELVSASNADVGKEENK